MRTYTLYWKDEDTNRVRSEEFSNKTGWDHSAMNAALEMAEEADANLFPWLLEEDGYVVAFGRVEQHSSGEQSSSSCAKTHLELRDQAETTNVEDDRHPAVWPSDQCAD